MPLPLKNRNIVVTRDQYQTQILKKKIEDLGGKVIAFPVIKIEGASDWEQCDTVFDEMRNLDWIVFTSSNSVRFFMGRAKYVGIDHIQAKIAAVGTKTAEEIEKYDLKAALIPEDFSAEGLLNEYKKLDLKGKRMLIPASNLAKEHLPNGLAAMGAEVRKCVVYNTMPNTNLDGTEMRTMIETSSVDCLTFFSPSAFHFFLDIVGRDIIKVLIKKKIAIAAIGPVTSKAIKKEGLDPNILPEKSDEDSLLESLNKYFNH